MTFTITNIYYKLVIRLQTNLTTIPTLTYNHQHNSTITNKTVTETNLSNGIITYTIRLSEYEVGDVLKDFVCTLSGTQNLYDLNEGLTILVDGEETEVLKVENGNVVLDSDNQPTRVNPVKSSQFAIKFQDTDIHTVQAIYKGNSNIGVGLSDKIPITPLIENDPEPETEGGYKIEFTKYKDTMNYMGEVDWQVRLTKGETGVANALIQIDTPVSTYTYRTNSNGYVTFKRTKTTIQNDDSQLAPFRNWNVGKYTIQARYHYYETDEGDNTVFEELICKTSKKLTINKGTPSMSVVKYAQTKKGTATFKLKDPMGFNLENTKLTEVVNGKTYNKKTNTNGNVGFKLGVKGYVKYTFKYAGNKNMKAKNWTFSETIS